MKNIHDELQETLVCLTHETLQADLRAAKPPFEIGTLTATIDTSQFYQAIADMGAALQTIIQQLKEAGKL